MKMKHLAVMGVLGMALVLPPMVRADDAPAPAPAPPANNHPKRNGFMGKFSAVDATAKTVTVTNRKGEAKTFNIPDGVKIKVDGQDGKLEDIKVDYFGGVMLADDNTTVLAVRASEKAPQHRGQQGPPPAAAPAPPAN